MLWFKKKEKVNKEAEAPVEAVAETESLNVDGSEVSSDAAATPAVEADPDLSAVPAYDEPADNASSVEDMQNDAVSVEGNPVPQEDYSAEAAEADAVAAEAVTEKAPAKTGFFAKLKQGLKRTRDNFVYNLDVVFKGAEEIDDAFYDDLEEILITGDIGVQTTEEILERLKENVSKKHIVRPDECRELLVSTIEELMHVDENEYVFEKETSVIFVIGVNGVGKTTSIGKLASQFKNDGKRVIIAAADTFRAAAGDQLKVWADRAGCELISGKEGADPSSVLFDAVAAARARRADILLVDTAGRLNNKKNLMNELSKMNKIIDKNYPEAHRENFIVLDATTGQNALQQALAFNEVSDLTGIILTKMDGTAKGGIAVAIQSSLHVPVKYIGVGEKIEDLQKFDEKAYVKALFERDKEETAEA